MSSRRLVTKIRNDLPRIVEIQFCLTKVLMQNGLLNREAGAVLIDKLSDKTKHVML